MGDVVHALPLASDIRNHFPDAHIDWVVEETFAAIPRLHSAVDQVIPVAVRRWRRTLWRPSTWRQIGAVRTRLRTAQYDHVIDCQGLMKSAWIARWAKGANTVVSGFDWSSAREKMATWFYGKRFAVARDQHAVVRNRRLGALALGYTMARVPRFDLSAGPLLPELQTVYSSAPVAVLLTNASRATKLWPDDQWQQVYQSLVQRGMRSVLFWGSEAERLSTQQRARTMQGAIVAPRCALEHVVTALAHARVVVGLDTGLTHLANALGVPTVAIFCDYDPKLVGVLGDAAAENLGGADGGPKAKQVMGAIDRVLQPPDDRDVQAPTTVVADSLDRSLGVVERSVV